MFERASRKLGLEVAVLGGDLFRKDRTTLDGEEEENVDRPSKAEMESLLKKGAYALMEDDEVSNCRGCDNCSAPSAYAVRYVCCGIGAGRQGVL